MIFLIDTVFLHGVLQILSVRTQRLVAKGLLPVYIGDDQCRYFVLRCFRSAQHLCKTFGAIIKLMVSKGCYIIAYRAHHAKFTCFLFVYGLKWCTHGKITRIKDEGLRIFFLFLVDYRLDFRELLKMGVHIVRKHDRNRIAALCGCICQHN